MKYSTLALAAAMAACGGCATAPQRSVELENARAAVQTLSAEPDAAQAAGKPLQDARNALAQAEAAQAAHKPLEQVEHPAYLARRDAEIGMAAIAEAHAREQVAQAEAERNRVVMQAREREADVAKQRAREAEARAAAAGELAAQRQAATEAAQQSEQAVRAQLAELQARQTERGMVMTLGSVLFDTARDALKPGAELTMDRLSRVMQSYPDLRIIVEGHTDSRGSDAYNDALSQRRAQSVASALESRGIAPDRIRPVGRGKGYPVASNDTPEGRQQNRRVEIVFSDVHGQFLPGAER